MGRNILENLNLEVGMYFVVTLLLLYVFVSRLEWEFDEERQTTIFMGKFFQNFMFIVKRDNKLRF
jgi:hypothetical protein